MPSTWYWRRSGPAVACCAVIMAATPRTAGSRTEGSCGRKRSSGGCFPGSLAPAKSLLTSPLASTCTGSAGDGTCCSVLAPTEHGATVRHAQSS